MKLWQENRHSISWCPTSSSWLVGPNEFLGISGSEHSWLNLRSFRSPAMDVG